MLRSPAVSAKPKQPSGADKENPADRKDDRARPLSKSVIGHPPDDKRPKRRACDRQQDRRTDHPQRQVPHAAERAEIEHPDDMAERLRDGFGRVRRLAIERTLLEEDIEKEPSDPSQDLDD